MRKPWFRKQDGNWYVTTAGEQVKLGPDEKRAFRKWHAMQAAGDVEAEDVTLIAIVEAFLRWSKSNQAPKTYEWYSRYLADLCNSLAFQEVRRLKPYHITRWIEGNGWQGSSK